MKIGMEIPDMSLHATKLLAGFWGAIVGVLAVPPARPWQAVPAVVVGVIAAHYLSDDVSRLSGLSVGASGLLVGSLAIAVTKRALALVETWRPKWWSNGGSGRAA